MASLQFDSLSTIQTDHKKRSSKGGWNAAIFVIFVEMAERFCFYGLSGNLITYLTNNLGESIAKAAKNVNTWVGVSYIFPILGAFIADSYIGRFKTIIASSVIYFLGMVLLTLSVSVIPEHSKEAIFFTALYIVAIGEGGHRPCVQAFAADQFDDNNPEEKVAKSSFFNWWYLGIMSGASLALVAAVYLQDNVSWTAGLGVLAGAIAIAFALFLMGMRRYRKMVPTGSPFASVAQVFIAAAKKWRLSETHDGRGIYYEDQRSDSRPPLVRTKQFRFLDKAMIIDQDDALSITKNPWRLCSLTQVEEVKLVLRLLPIWTSCLMFSVVFVQLQTFFVKQGSTMMRSIGSNLQVPPAALQSLVGPTLLIFIPFYDWIFVPTVRKISGHHAGITMLQRIGIGLFLSILTMVVASLVETRRINIAKNHKLDNPRAIVPMSIWWLVPQYVLMAIAEAFTVIGLQELFYDQVPDGLKSLGAAAFISIIGVGSFINNAIISIVQKISLRDGNPWLANNLNHAKLNYYYWVLAGLSFINLCVYLLISSRFVYKKIECTDETREEVEIESN